MENYGDRLPVPEVTPLKTSTPESVSPGDRVLLVRLSAIGDALRILPVVQYFRTNDFDGRIDCAVQPPTEDLLEPFSGLDTVYTLPLKQFFQRRRDILSVLRRIRQNNYDWVFDFHGLLKSGVLSYLSGCSRRVGYSKTKSRELNYYFQTTTLKTPLPGTMPRVLKYLQLVRPFTRNYSFTRRVLRPDAGTFQSSSDELRDQANKNPILLHPSSSHSRYGTKKEWGISNFVALVRNLLSLTNRPVYVTWGPGERTTAEQIVEDLDDRRVEVSAETHSLRDLAYLIQRASLVISVDTSIPHIADMLGTPLVVVFGGSSPYINAPLFTTSRYVTRWGSEENIEDVPVDRLLVAVRDILREIDS